MSDILTRFRTKREPEKARPAPASKGAKRPPYAPVPLEEAANLHRALRGSNGMIVELAVLYGLEDEGSDVSPV